jgi:hypothetical protein
MQKTGLTERMGRKNKSESFQGKDHLKCQCLEGKTRLTYASEKQVVKLWTGLEISNVANGNKPSNSVNDRNYLMRWETE